MVKNYKRGFEIAALSTLPTCVGTASHLESFGEYKADIRTKEKCDFM